MPLPSRQSIVALFFICAVAIVILQSSVRENFLPTGNSGKSPDPRTRSFLFGSARYVLVTGIKEATNKLSWAACMSDEVFRLVFDKP